MVPKSISCAGCGVCATTVTSGICIEPDVSLHRRDIITQRCCSHQQALASCFSKCRSNIVWKLKIINSAYEPSSTFVLPLVLFTFWICPGTIVRTYDHHYVSLPGPQRFCSLQVVEKHVLFLIDTCLNSHTFTIHCVWILVGVIAYKDGLLSSAYVGSMALLSEHINLDPSCLPWSNLT